MLGQTIILDEIERTDRESIGFTNLIEDRYISYSDCNIEYLNSDEIMNHQLYTISNTLGVIAFVNSENCIKISSTFEIHEYIQKRHEVPKTIYEQKLDSTPSFIKFSENGMNLVVSVRDEIIIFTFTKELKFKTLRHKFNSEIIEFDCKLDNKIFILLDTNNLFCLDYEHGIAVKKVECVTDCSTICSNSNIVNSYLLVGTKTSDILLVNFEKDLVLFKCKIDDIQRVHCLNWFDKFYCTFSTFIPFNDAFDFKIVILQLNHECFLGHPSSDKELVIQGGSCMEFFPDYSKPVTMDTTCRYHSVYLDHWKMLLCSTTTDSRVVVFQQIDDKFNLLALNSKWSIDTFPLYNDDPTFSLGLIADFGYDYQIDNIKSKTDAAKHEGSPLIHIYLTSGFIVTYALTNCDELNRYPLVHASKTLGDLTIEELPEERKAEPNKPETPTKEEKPKESLIVATETTPVKEEKPTTEKIIELPKPIVVEQPKTVFNPIPNTAVSTGFNFGNTATNNSNGFNFNTPITKPLQPDAVTTQPNINFTPTFATLPATQPTGFIQTPFVNQPITSQKNNTVVAQPTIPETIVQKQPLGQPKANAMDKIGSTVTTGIVDKNMIQSINNFSSNLTNNSETGGFKKDFKPIISKPLKHDPINPISLVPNSKPSQTSSKPSSVVSLKNDLAIIQSKSSKSKSDEKIQQLSKETAKKVHEVRVKFSLLKNAIENINNNQENDFKFTKSDISTTGYNIDKLNSELVKSDESLKQRVERLNEYLNRECSIVELLDIKIKENKKESLKENGLDETAQYFKDIISHKFSNILTNIEHLEKQVNRKLNLAPQKLPTLICLQNTLSLQRSRAVEYRKYVISLAQKLESKEHISKTDQFIQQLTLGKPSTPNRFGYDRLKSFKMTRVKPIVNNSAILKKKINLVHEDDTTLYKDYENIDEISEIYYEDEESKNPLNESFIQSENSSLDLLDDEDEDDNDTNSPINFNASKPNFATTTFPQPTSFAQQPVQPKPAINNTPIASGGGFNFGEPPKPAVNSTPFNASLSTKTTVPTTTSQFAFGSTTSEPKGPTSVSLGAKVEPFALNTPSGFNLVPTTVKPVTEKKDTIAFGTTPGFSFGTPKAETTPLVSTPTIGFGFGGPVAKKEPTSTTTTSIPSGLRLEAEKTKEAIPSGFSFGNAKTETTGSSGFSFGATEKKDIKKEEPIEFNTKVSSTKEQVKPNSDFSIAVNDKKEKSLDSESTSAKVETKSLSNSFGTTPFSFGATTSGSEKPTEAVNVETKQENKPEEIKPTTLTFGVKKETTPVSTPSSGFSFGTDTKKEPTNATTLGASGFSFGSAAVNSDPKAENKNDATKKAAETLEIEEKKDESSISDIFPTKKIATTPTSSEKSSFFESPPPATDSKTLLSGFAKTDPSKEIVSFNISKDTNPLSETNVEGEEPKKEEPKTEPKKEETKSTGFSFGATASGSSGFNFTNTNPQSESKPVEDSAIPKIEETKPTNVFGTNPFGSATPTVPKPQSESKPVEASTIPKIEETKPNTETKPTNVFGTNPFGSATPIVTKPAETTSFSSTATSATIPVSTNSGFGLPSTNTIPPTKDENGMEDNDDVMVGNNALGSLSLGSSNNSGNNPPSGFTSFMNNAGSSNISSAFPSSNTITTFGSGNTSGSGGSFFEPVNNSVGDSPFSNPSSNSSLPFAFQGNSSFGSQGSFSFDSGRGSSFGSAGTGTPSGFGTSSFGNANNNSVLTSGFGSNTLNTDTTKTFGTSFGASGFASKTNTPAAGGFGSGGFGSGSFGSSTSQPVATTGGFGSGGFGSGGFSTANTGSGSGSGFGSFSSSTAGSSPFSSLSTGSAPSFLQGNNNPTPSFGGTNNGNTFGSFGSFGGFGKTN